MPNFQCHQCGACCRQPGFVYVTEQDARRLSEHFGKDIYTFTEAYCLLQDRRHLVLKKNFDETCLFLKKNGCEIYEARPAQCREFPSKWKTERSLRYCEGLRVKE